MTPIEAQTFIETHISEMTRICGVLARPIGHMTKADVQQELVTIAIDLIQRGYFDPAKGPLERWLRHSLANRLKNIKRRVYGHRELPPERAQRHKAIRRAFPLSTLSEDKQIVDYRRSRPVEPDEQMQAEELSAKIEFNLPTELIAPYHLLIAGGKVAKKTKAQIQQWVRWILNDDLPAEFRTGDTDK